MKEILNIVTLIFTSIGIIYLLIHIVKLVMKSRWTEVSRSHTFLLYVLLFIIMLNMLHDKVGSLLAV